MERGGGAWPWVGSLEVREFSSKSAPQPTNPRVSVVLLEC